MKTSLSTVGALLVWSALLAAVTLTDAAGATNPARVGIEVRVAAATRQRQDPPTTGTPASTPLPPIAFLYHSDADERVRALRTLAASGNRDLLDDLVRAHAAEFYTPVHNAYFEALREMTGNPKPRGPGQWKAWLATEAEAGRLKIDYRPLNLQDLTPEQRGHIQPLAEQLGPEHLASMTAALTNEATFNSPHEALRYLVANDHRPEVQAFLEGPWLCDYLAQKGLHGSAINGLAYNLNALANPGPLRDRINAQIAACLESDNAAVVTHALWLLAGVEGYSTRFVVTGVTDQVRRLLDHPDPQVIAQARRALDRLDPLWAAAQVTYEEAFTDLYQTLGRQYPAFRIKGIDWEAVGRELLPRVQAVKTDEEFGRLCLELVARLEDSHAYLMPGTARVPTVPFPLWDPGFTSLLDDRQKPVVYYVDPDGPADRAGVRIGMTVIAVNGEPADQRLERLMRETSKYRGYSSDRYLRYHAAQWLGRELAQGARVALEMQPLEGQPQTFEAPATLGVRYLPRLPVPIPGIRDSGDVSWTRLTNNIGYIYVRRINPQLIPRLDQAIAELKDAHGVIVDVRGNSGGGFDGSRAHRNFSLTDPEEPDRARFRGPMALLIDARCISAGEGWASWFIAQQRARVFGEATAGASARKTVYTLKNGLFKVQYPVKAYTGFLDRPIERRGLEPDVPIKQNASDLAAGRDTVLTAARQYLLEQDPATPSAPTPETAEPVARRDLDPLPPLPALEDLPGTLTFQGRYQHRNYRRDIAQPSQLWLKETPEGALTALADLPFMGIREIISSDAQGRLTRSQIGQTGSGSRAGYRIELEFQPGQAWLTRRGLRQDHDRQELPVPADAWFDPNTRPDSYCAANVLLRTWAPKPGEAREVRVFDWDNTGNTFADYTLRIEHLGRESVAVPAGTFDARHLKVTQLTSANTWFKKRAGHVTEFWVLDNHVIVRVLRHREPYEMVLLDCAVPEALPGKKSGPAD